MLEGHALAGQKTGQRFEPPVVHFGGSQNSPNLSAHDTFDYYSVPEEHRKLLAQVPVDPARDGSAGRRQLGRCRRALDGSWSRLTRRRRVA